MANHTLIFEPSGRRVTVPTGTLVVEGLAQAGLDIGQPCGGQGRCGRCAVVVRDGQIRRRSTIRLPAADLAAGYALACQAVVESDATVFVPPQEQIERQLVTDKAAAPVALPFPYDPHRDQTVRAFRLALEPPSLDDAGDDAARLEGGLRACGVAALAIPLALLRELGARLRAADWQVVAIVDTAATPPRLIDLLPAGAGDAIWGLAIDIGTTTVSVQLVDLLSGAAVDRSAEYNGQIARGEDVISRIVYAGKNGGLAELQERVRATINDLIGRLSGRRQVPAERIVKASVSGNPTMLHLFLGLPPETIRLSPYVPTVNRLGPLLAGELGLGLHPQARVECLPGVASYVGADITAGVLAAGVDQSDALTLFIDVGTNGEMVLGNRDFLVTCACSAGPAFEGAGVVCGMRATRGAIEEVWVNSRTYEPTVRVIGNTRPRGICGSGLIALLAELFVTGVVDKGGRVKLDLPTPRVRRGEHGPEYVVAWAAESAGGRDIVLTAVDIDNLMRAKAAVYAGFQVLAQSVGVDLADVEQVLVGGSFGQYINVEKAVQIGLLPDLPWERFGFLGNTSLQGSYRALLARSENERLQALAAKMTYIELSADNTFYDAFTSALFLPHTDASRFPTVAKLWAANGAGGSGEAVLADEAPEAQAGGAGEAESDQVSEEERRPR